MKKQRLISLGIAVAAIASVVLLYRFVLIKKLVSDDYVRSLYSSHKDEIERLKSMCLEDQKKSGIGFFAVSAHSRTDDCMAGSVERCQEYLRLLTVASVMRVGWKDDGVWLMVDGWGLFGGRRKGLLWRATPIPTQSMRNGQRYLPIEGGWYIYDVTY